MTTGLNSGSSSSSITLFIHADPVNRSQLISTRGVFQKITLHDKQNSRSCLQKEINVSFKRYGVFRK